MSDTAIWLLAFQAGHDVAVGGVFMVLAALAVMGIRLGMASDDVRAVRYSGRQEKRDEASVAYDRAQRDFGRWFAALVVFGTLSSVVPSSDQLVRAYVMGEAKKVLTAEKAERAIDGFTQRIDKLIEALGKSGK